MMVIPRLFSRAQRKLPDVILAELVTMLIAGRVPIVVMGVTVALVTAFAASATFAIPILILGGSVIALLAIRFAIVSIYLKKVPLGLSAEAVSRWESRYTVVIICYAAFLGAFNAFATIGGDTATHLMVVAEVFGFCAGQVSRGTARPKLCAAAVLLCAVPTAIGMVITATQIAGMRESFAYVVIALLITLYAFSSLETIAYGYRTLVSQLENKRQMAGLARLDALTGLPNRLVLTEQLQLDLRQIRNGGLAIALHMIDLDGFKQINDNYGHPIGDALLHAVAERLTRMLRTGDIAFRLGGDEFVIIQKGFSIADEANLLGRRIIRQLAEPFKIGEIDLRIGASVGIATAPGNTEDLDELIEHADNALYSAKRGGRGRVSVWRSNGPQVATIAA